MFKKMKVGDIVRSPHGNMEILRFHINGYATIKQRFPPFEQRTISSITARSFPIVERPGHVRSLNRYKTFDGASMSPAYVAWRSLRKRAETVCVEWTDFQVFAEWFHQTLDGYPDWESVRHDWMVAFDLIEPSNRLASPELCCLVPFPVYAVLSDHAGRTRRNDLPRGVTQMANRFVVHCSRFDTGVKRIGSYATANEASAAYWAAKIDAVRYTGIIFWSFMPEKLAMRMISFGPADAARYFPKEFD